MFIVVFQFFRNSKYSFSVPIPAHRCRRRRRQQFTWENVNFIANENTNTWPFNKRLEQNPHCILKMFRILSYSNENLARRSSNEKPGVKIHWPVYRVVSFRTHNTN